MVFHVGIDAKSGDAAAYSDITKITIKFETGVVFSSIFDKIESVDDLFKIIKSKLMGDLGYLCFSMHDYTRNKIRKECIKKGKEYGFSKVFIINSIAELYLACFLNYKKKPKNGEIIWTFIRNKYVIWEKTDTYAKLIKIFDYYPFSVVNEKKLLQIKKDSGIDKNPNLIFSDIGGYNHFSEIVNSTFPDCKFVLHKNTVKAWEIALINARIAADDPNLNANIKTCDIDNYFHHRIVVKVRASSSPKGILNLKEGFILNKGQLLPFEKSLTLPVKDDEKIMEIYWGYWDINYHSDWVNIEITPEMLKVGEISLVIRINESCIFSFEYSIIKTVENTEPRIKKVYENQITSETETYNIPKKELISNLNMNAIGIDLGMTRCCVAVNRNDRFELVATDNAEKQLPSFISFKEKEPICGQLVINQLQFYANSTVFDIKRIIGRNFEETEINPSWPFEIIKCDNDKPKIHVQNCDGNILEKHPEEISAILLKHMKKKIEEFQGRTMDEVVITVPAGFKMNQKIATHVAAELAGWNTVHLLSEPIAASIAYFVDRPIPPNFNMLLFDLGGGTLDLCIFNVEQNNLKVITNYGDNNLGGKNFDVILYEHFARILETNYQIIINQINKYQLMQKCVEIKHTLSVEVETSLDVEDFSREIDLFLQITRSDFEKMAAPLLEQISEILVETFSRIQISAPDVYKVLLVGGGCRMPMIQQFLRKRFPKADHNCAENPDEMVAIGAAYYSSFLMSKNGAKEIDATRCNIM